MYAAFGALYQMKYIFGEFTPTVLPTSIIIIHSILLPFYVWSIKYALNLIYIMIVQTPNNL